MTVPPDLEAQILRYHHVEKWRAGTIARQLSVHYDTVMRVLLQAGLSRNGAPLRGSQIEPYLQFIGATLEKFPTLTASRLFAMVRERGYRGGPDHFRHLVARHRPRPPAQAYLRLRSLPGEQAQVDWGHFGHLTIGRARRPLMAFVMVLSWSRWIFLRFFLDARIENFLRGHIAAFEAFKGCPRILLYDNLKSAVLERAGDAIRFHPALFAFAAHYRYEAAAWCSGMAADRPCPENRTQSVREAFAEEAPQLLALPDNPYPLIERVVAKVGKTPYVRFDLNDYSVPHTSVQRLLTVLADPHQVRIVDGAEILACHPRSYDKGAQIEIAEHIETLVAHKRAARRHRGTDHLAQAAPASQHLLSDAAARGDNLGTITAALLRLLDRYGAAELQAAIGEALARGVPHPNAVRLALEQRREQRQAPPPVAVDLPANIKARDAHVTPHRLEAYDQLKEPIDE